MHIKTIVINGPPKGQPRPRYVKRGSFVQIYDPAGKLKQKIRAIISEQFVEAPIESSIEAVVTFFFKPPKSTSKKNVKLMLDNDTKHVKKPDIDNIQKLFFDVMTGLVYHDDNQIWKVKAEKRYSMIPRTEIRLEW